MLAVVDIEMGNLRSVLNALRFVGATPTVIKEPREVRKASRIILPGVGAYRRAMKHMQDKGWDQALIDIAARGTTPILGICLGMQILGKSGTEGGVMKGLGLIDGIVEQFCKNSHSFSDLRIPHMGFNTVKVVRSSAIFQDMRSEVDFYFMHSYRMICTDEKQVVAYCQHGIKFAAAVQNENVYGVQYHPEKSQHNGLHQLRNFLEHT